MRSVVLTPLAEEDIVAIAAYTLANWGEAQMDRYVGDLHDRFEQLTRFPDSGRLRRDIGRGYRSIVQGSHIVFYRVTTRNVVIVRVLHDRMRHERHLPD